MEFSLPKAFTGILSLLLLFLSGIWAPKAIAATCVPVSASITVQQDDELNFYINGNQVGPGAPGTFMGSNNNSNAPTTFSFPVSDLNNSGNNWFAVQDINTTAPQVGCDWVISITCADGSLSYITSSDNTFWMYDDYTNGGAAPPNDGSGNPWYSPNWVNPNPGVYFNETPVAVTYDWWYTPINNPITNIPVMVLSVSDTGHENPGDDNENLYFREAIILPEITPTITLTPTITPTPYPPGCGPPTFVQASIIGHGCIGSEPNFSFAYNVPVNPNTLLVIRIEDSASSGGTFTNVKYGGQAMTLQSSFTATNLPSTPDYLLTYYLANPPTGAQNFTFSNPSSNECSWNIAAEVYQNVNVLAPLGPYNGTQTGSSNASQMDSVSITTTGPASLVSDYMASDQADSSIPTGGANQHSFLLTGEAGSEGVYGDYETVNGPGTYILTYNVHQANRPYAAQPIEIEGSICGTLTDTPTYTPVLSPTDTGTFTETLTPSPVVSPTLTPSFSSTYTLPPTPSFTPTKTITLTATITPTYSDTATNGPSPTPIPTGGVFKIVGVFPNPVGPSGTKIYIQIPEPGTVTGTIYTLKGECVFKDQVLWQSPKAVGGDDNYLQWLANNLQGNPVAFGNYVLIVNFQGATQSETTSRWISVVR